MRGSGKIVLCGALVVCAAIAASVPCAVLADSHRLRLGGTGGDLGTMKQLSEAFSRAHPDDVHVEVLPSLGSGGGIKAVLAGVIDLGLTARALTDQEREAGAQETAYAKVPLAPITSDENPADDVSSAHLTDIFAGDRTTWADGSLIRLVLRPRIDSDTKVLIAHIPGIHAAYDKAMKRRGVPVALSDQDAADQIQSSRGALAMISLTVVLGENRPLKALSLDGVAPTPENIANGTYPMTKTFYFVTGPEMSEISKKFIAYVRSPEGQDILRRTGHHPL